MLTFSCGPGYIACWKMKAEVSKNYTSMILYNYFFVYPVCCSFYHGFAHVFKFWLLYVSLWNINATPDRAVGIARGSQNIPVLFVTPCWRATRLAKQLSTATTLFCWGSVGVGFMSHKVNFLRSTVSLAVHMFLNT